MGDGRNAVGSSRSHPIEACESSLRRNLGAVEFKLTTEQVQRLDTASTPQLAYPYWHQRRMSMDCNSPPTP